ncbi:MAG: FUSC family protein [Proteobacteria bacterium]|nr:FUSC family protein [Pseudomonadota bacterium]
MEWPEPRDWVFAAKAFGGAMLAYWIACALNLPHAAWAMFTVFALMQPISGAVRSKSVYRLGGTVLGVGGTLALVGQLADLSGALVLALGFASLGLMFLGQLDRTPRGQIYSYAGITVPVVGLADVLDPSGAFVLAQARAEAVLLGILCAVAVDSAFFPHPAGMVLNRRVAAWLADARDYTLRALDLSAGGAAASDHAALGRLAATAAELDTLAFHVPYDMVPRRPPMRTVRMLHTRMLGMIRSLYATADWLATQRAGLPEIEPAARAAQALRAWASEIPAPSPAREAEADRALAALRPAPGDAAGVVPLLRGALAATLQEFVDEWRACLALQRAVADGSRLPATLRAAARRAPLAAPYRDPLRAFLVLLPTAIAYLLVVGYWTATGWDEGVTAAIMTLVAGFFAITAAEPARTMRLVAVLLFFCMAVALIYQFAVIPAVNDFVPLAAALAVWFLPVSAFIPRTKLTAMALAALTAAQMALQPEYDAQFGPVLDGMLGSMAGVITAAAIATLIDTAGTAWTLRHLRRQGWTDLALIAAGRWRPTRTAFLHRTLDRYAELAPHLDAPGGDPALTSETLLNELRVGLNLLRLNEVAPSLPPAALQATEGLRAALAVHYRTGRPPGRVEALAAPRDAALRAAEAALPAPAAATAWLMVAGMAHSLFGTRHWPGAQEA